jgi:hypothetical protein
VRKGRRRRRRRRLTGSGEIFFDESDVSVVSSVASQVVSTVRDIQSPVPRAPSVVVARRDSARCSTRAG